ncbi:metal ABC transporter permease [Synechococcus elongatus IITB5]
MTLSERDRLLKPMPQWVLFSQLFARSDFNTLIQKQNKIDLNHFLFGNLLAVSPADLRDTAIVASLVAIAIVLFHKELQFYCFDRLAAQAAGLPVRWFDLGLTVILAMTIVVAMKAVGVLLVIAMLITARYGLFMGAALCTDDAVGDRDWKCF